MLVEKLIREGALSKEEYAELLRTASQEDRERLREAAWRIRQEHYGNQVYLRGLIEFTNYCKNNCHYCGIRAGNATVERYRLTMEEILGCCENGYHLGYRTFVLQGGEDPYFDDGRMEEIVQAIREAYPDCAITLSLGERSYESYRRLRQAGADRYLLRHETAVKSHYETLHPANMSFENRRKCLRQLKELGYQVGAGFMVGSPGQTKECLAEDLLFLKEFAPHMVGIGPFVPHHETPFRGERPGSVEETLLLLSIIRILLPKALLPATTALGTMDEKGREKGLLAGANVVMPNLSPARFRKKYEIYDNKLCTGVEAAEGREDLERRISSVGCQIASHRGDAKL